MHNTASAAPDLEQLSSLQRLWLCESIRQHEQHHPLLEDSEACRLARQQGQSLQQRIELRNLTLARQQGLTGALQNWLTAARWLGLALTTLALLTGYGLASTALSRQADTINVVWALFGLLGLHLVTLLFWLAGMLFRPGQPSWFMQLPLDLTGRISRSPHAARLTSALLSLLGRRHLLPAALSRLAHGWWLLVLLTALLASLMLLGTHRYAFVWETTIAQPDSFVSLVQILGWPGQWLGFALPDAELIRASGEQLLSDELSRRTWASWLMGVLVVYGLLPRLLLAMFFQWRWQRGKQRLQLDENSADWAYLHARLQSAVQSGQIIDPAPQQIPQPEPATSSGTHSHALLAGLELEEPLQWPLEPPASLHQLGNLDGYAAQQALLEQLAARPGQALVLACDSRRSPDRGSLHFISELARSCNLQVWLLHAEQDPQRLSGWQQALKELQVAHSTSAPWLTTGTGPHD